MRREALSIMFQRQNRDPNAFSQPLEDVAGESDEGRQKGFLGRFSSLDTGVLSMVDDDDTSEKYDSSINRDPLKEIKDDVSSGTPSSRGWYNYTRSFHPDCIVLI